MPEDTSSTSTSETRNEADPTTETVTTQQNGATPGSTTTEPSIDDLKAQVQRMETALSKANKDGKEHRLSATELATKLKDLESFKAKVDAEKMSDEEKRQLERQTLEKQLADLQKEKETATRQTQELRVTNEVFKHGQRLNIIDLDAARKLLDADQIVYEDGQPANIEALLKTLVKERSWLVGKQQQQTSGGATNPSRSTSSSQALSWEIISELSMKDPAQYRARREEIQQWMSSNPGPR